MKQLLLIAWLFPLLGYAQETPVTDSLLKQLSISKEDTGKVLLLIAIGQEYENNEPEKAKQYYLQAKQVSESLDYTIGIIKYYSNYTAVLNIQGRYDSSLLLAKEALVLANSYGNKEKIAIMQQNLSASYSLNGDYENAIRYHLLSLPYFEQHFTESRFALLYNNLATYYWQTKQYENALGYHQKALNLARKYNDYFQTATALQGLATVYMGLRSYDKAIPFFSESLLIAKNENNTFLQQAILHNLLNIYIRKGEYDSLLQYSNAEIDLSKTLGDSVGIARGIYGLSLYYFFQKNFLKSGELANEGYQIAQRNNHIEQMETLAYVLSMLALVRKDFKAFHYYEQLSNEMGEKVFNKDMQQNIQLLDKKYETEKKERLLKLQQATIRQKNMLNYILGGGAAALLVILLLGYRNYKHKRNLQQQKIADLEKEKLLLATQSILKGQEEERSRLAKDLHDGLGGLLSGVKLQLGAMKGNIILSEEHGRIFNNAIGKLDESISEMRRVAHNMMPEALMKLGLQQALQDYCDGLSESQPFTINCEFHALEKRMPSTIEIVVYRIVQELLNNAVKHSGATAILAQVIRQGDNLSITVEDNGKGFDVYQTDITKSAGLANVKARVDYLKGQMDIQSAPDKRTSVHIDCIIDDNG